MRNFGGKQMKYIFNLFLFTLGMLFTTSIYGVETYQLICTDQNVINISHEDLNLLAPHLLSMIQLNNNYLQNANDRLYYINLNDNKFAEHNLKIEALLSADNIQTLVTCIKNPKKVNDIFDDNIVNICRIADYFGPSEKTLYALAKRLKKFKELKEYDLSNSDNDDASFIKEFIDLNEKRTVTRLIDQKIINQYCGKTLNLSNQNLVSLNGIKALGNKENVTTLNLSSNQLTSLDISDLCTQFPRLTSIIAMNNKIQELNNQNMRRGLSVDVRNNQITSVNLGKFNKNTLDIRKNPLTPETLEQLVNLLHTQKPLLRSIIQNLACTTATMGSLFMASQTFLYLNKAINRPGPRAFLVLGLFASAVIKRDPDFMLKSLGWVFFPAIKAAKLVKFTTDLIIERYSRSFDQYPSKILYSTSPTTHACMHK